MLTGDFGVLEQFRRQVGGLGAIPRAVASEGASRLEQLAASSSAAALDPFGAPWPALKSGGSGSPATAVFAQQDGCIQAEIVPPGGFRQTGTRRRSGRGVHAAPRPVLPTEELPPAWESALAETTAAAFERALGGAT